MKTKKMARRPERQEADDPLPPNAALEGRLIGGFGLGALLGQGGMSRVYRAIRESDGMPAAVKLLATGTADDATSHQRFHREAEAIRGLDHPHIVPLLDYGTDEGIPFLALQLIEGKTFAEIAREQDGSTEKPQPDRLAATVAVQPDATSPPNVTSPSLTVEHANGFRVWSERLAPIAEALQAAHLQGMVHRDVKSSNLMLDRDGHVWLTDFGLATVANTYTALTQTGQVVGTPHYMSPEQAAGDDRPVDQRSDIYSLGATLYELTTGQRPYRGDHRKILVEISIGRLTPPSRVCPQIPRPLEAIILKAMAYAAEDRYDSAAAMAADLRRFVAGEVTLARTPTWADRSIRWMLQNPQKTLGTVAGIAASVLLALGVQYGVTQRLGRLNQRLEATNEVLAETNVDLEKTNRDLDRSRSQLQRQLYVADLEAAYRAYAERDLDVVRQLLDRHLPEPPDDPPADEAVREKRAEGQDVPGALDRRGFAWWLLHHLAQPPQMRMMAGHQGSATEVRLLPGHREALSVGHDGRLRQWDLGTGALLREETRGGELDALAVSPTGTRIVTGEKLMEEDNRVVSLRLGQDDAEVQTLTPGHGHTIEAAAWSPDGQWLATASRYAGVLLHNAAGEAVGRVETGSRNRMVAFSPDGTELLTVFRKRRKPDTVQLLRAWSLPDLQTSNDYPLPFSIETFALSEDGKRLVGANHHQWTVVRWPDLRPLVIERDGRGPISCVALDAKGDRLAAGCGNGLLAVWDLPAVEGAAEEAAKPAKPLVINTGKGQVTSLQFGETAAGESLLVASLASGKVQAWSLETRAVPHPTLGVSTRAMTRRMTDNDQLWLRSDNGEIHRLDLSRGEQNGSATVPPDTYCELAVSEDGETLAVAAPGELVVIGALDGSERYRFATGVPEKPCRDLWFVDAGRQLLVLFNDRLRRYELPTGKLREEQMIPEDDARAILPAPDGEGWLVVSAHGLVWLERESFRRLATYLRRLSRICRARYSADGTRLAVGHLDGSIEILRVSDLQRIGLLRGHRGEIGDVWFIENDQTLISSGREGPLRFWDVESGRSMGTLAVGETSTTLLHFDRQRQHLWALGPNRPTKLWSGARGTTTNRTNSTTEAD